MKKIDIGGVERLKKTIAIYVLGAALLSGCSGANDSKTDTEKIVKADETKTQELVLVMPLGNASVKYRIDTFQKYIQQFETENPGVHIKIETLPAQSYQKDLNARLKEGKQTDLIFAPFYPLLAEAGVYADLLSFFKTDRTDINDLYESLTKMATTTKGNLIGIPMSPAPLGVYYNKEWFDKAGISYPGGDWTWEQYFDLSIKLKAANAVANKEVFGSAIPFELSFIESLVQSGGSILSPDNSKVSGYLDSRSLADAFALLANLKNTNNAIKVVENMGNPTLYEMWDGNVGMSIAPYGMYSFLEQTNRATAGKTAVAPLPRLEKGKKVNSVTIQTLSVTALSKQQELAWKFIKDVILNVDSGFHKDWSRQELLTSKSAVQKTGQASDPVSKVFLEELNYGITPSAYRNPYLPSILMTKKNIGSVLDAPTSEAVQTALTEAAQTIDQQLPLAAQQ